MGVTSRAINNEFLLPELKVHCKCVEPDQANKEYFRWRYNGLGPRRKEREGK